MSTIVNQTFGTTVPGHYGRCVTHLPAFLPHGHHALTIATYAVEQQTPC